MGQPNHTFSDMGTETAQISAAHFSYSGRLPLLLKASSMSPYLCLGLFFFFKLLQNKTDLGLQGGVPQSNPEDICGSGHSPCPQRIHAGSSPPQATCNISSSPFYTPESPKEPPESPNAPKRCQHHKHYCECLLNSADATK